MYSKIIITIGIVCERKTVTITSTMSIARAIVINITGNIIKTPTCARLISINKCNVIMCI